MPVKRKRNSRPKLYPAKIAINPRTGKTRIFVSKAVARAVNPKSMHEYLVMLFNKNASRNVPITVHAATAGQASKLAKKQKASVVNEPRKWKVLSVKRVN